MRKIIIFTDLDGTLLRADDYSFSDAKEALSLINRHEIPLVIVSSKTRAEIEVYRDRLGNTHPFISENGGGVFIPLGYFKNTVGELAGRYRLIRLGRRYEELREVLNELKAEGFSIRGFGDMDIHELAGITGLSLEEAALAKQREFDEPFVFMGTEDEVFELNCRIQEKGLTLTKGEFFHLLGKTDKGKAVRMLKNLYTKQYGKILSIGLGDSFNDLPMLEVVDQAYLLQKLDGSYDRGVDTDHIQRVPAPGPEGWNKTVLEIIKKHEEQ